MSKLSGVSFALNPNVDKNFGPITSSSNMHPCIKLHSSGFTATWPVFAGWVIWVGDRENKDGDNREAMGERRRRERGI
jgi:hypothetical protein